MCTLLATCRVCCGGALTQRYVRLPGASRPGAAAGGGAAPSGLVTLLGGPGAGSHVLLADTPPSLELIPEKANNAGTVR